MTSSQRVFNYTQLPMEDDLVKPADKDLIEKNWPQLGGIKFDDLSMRYREGLEPSLKDLKFEAFPG